MKKILSLLIVAIASVCAFYAWQVIYFISTPMSTEHHEIIFEIPNGMAFHHVAHALEAQGLIRDERKFGWYAKATGTAARVKVGEYELSPDMKPREILDILVSGKSIAYSLVVPEGNNIFDIRDSLNELWPHRGDEFYHVVTTPALIQKITGEKLNTLEGYLFPDTYSLTKFTAVEALVRHMYDRFQDAIKETNKNSKVPMSLHDQVILASVIEKETGAPEERPMISSVFHNRLKKGMRLQSDPTILYGMAAEVGEMPNNISRADILRPSAYNTYTVKALPAGPISNPGKAALWAAVNPNDSNYFYFVSRNDGTHVFSESLDAHNKAVKKFQVDPKARAGKSWRDLANRPIAKPAVVPAPKTKN